MRLFYTILQLLLSPLALFFLPYLYITRKEQWHVLRSRLGHGLKSLSPANKKGPTIWIHALSVGETTSAMPLIKALSNQEPEIAIVLSVTTASGRKLAEEKLESLVDMIIPFPLDISFVVEKYLREIRPDLFILVETDFWPYILGSLSSKNIPALLVNGRISGRSMKRYRRFAFFFKPMFNQFSALCMQTQADADNMAHLGISRNKLKTLGNLKYQSGLAADLKPPHPFSRDKEHLLILCGSTHAGEEEAILEVYRELLAKHRHLSLVIAPRHPSRTEAVASLAAAHGFATTRYSKDPKLLEDILLIDTIGDLAGLYCASDIAFIGGSLVPAGGHNPLEAACCGIPAVFGQYMDDFQEISRELVESNAAFQVSDKDALFVILDKLVSSDQFRKNSGENAVRYLNHYTNVIPAHLEIIKKYL